MLNALYELGKTYIKKESTEKENFQEIDILLDELKTTKSIILVEFELNDNNLKWIDVKEKEFSSSDASNYLYKKGSSRGTNITPSALITKNIEDFEEKGKKKEGTFNLKFLKWFKSEKSDPFINLFYEEIKNNEEEIIAKMKDLYSKLESKNNVLITIAVKENGQTKYLNDFPVFQDHLKKVAGEKYYKMKSIKREMKGIGQCLLCGENKEVMGLVANQAGLAFSTVDKPGNIQELNQVNQWKMVPICFDCALNLEAGYKFVDKYLSFSEFGLRYYAIPRFLFKKDSIINKLFEYYISDVDKEKSYYNTIANQEEELIEEVEELDNIVEFKFFYEKNNNAFNILGNIESVVPSWINNLRENQINLIKNPLFQENFVKEIITMGKDKEKDFSGNFVDLYNSNKKEDYQKVKDSKWILGFLRDFFVYKDNNNFKFFLDVISSIFSHERINFNFILSYAMEKIRADFRNGRHYFMEIDTIELLMVFKLLLKLDLNLNGEIMENSIEENEKINEDEKNNQFLNYLDEIDTPAKKASFLLGILTRKLISKQYKELKSTPFTNKLWGMSLDENKIQKLYPIVINKLNEYKIAYTELYQEISENLVKANNNWKLTRDETSFYFVLGYTLFRLYKRPNSNTEENENNKIESTNKQSTLI